MRSNQSQNSSYSELCQLVTTRPSYVYEKENSVPTTFGTEVVQFKEVCLIKVKTYLLGSITDMRTQSSSGVVELVPSSD